MADKFDAIIEAARFKNGQIVYVRAYERRGPTFSDHILIDRKTLLEQMKNKKRFMTGARKEFLAGTFETRKNVQIIERDGNTIIATNPNALSDELEGTPVF